MKSKIVIVGAGTGGISVAARLAKELPASEILILDPALDHYYQPLWTLVGAGEAELSESRRSIESLIPSGVKWMRSTVKSVDPAAKKLVLSSGEAVEYQVLILAPGLELAWDRIENARESLGKAGVCTIYDKDFVLDAKAQIENFKGGRAVFVMPPVPIKCAGAPQKIMYLAEQIFRRNGVRENSEVIFATSGKAMFGIPVFAEALQKIVNERGIQPLFEHKIVAIHPDKKTAIFEVPNSDGSSRREEIKYDLLHLVPPMRAPDFVGSHSELALTSGDLKGWLAVDKATLQHVKYPEIFGIGDVTGVPNSKTGAAIRKQAPVVVANIMAFLSGQACAQKYDGYSSCPLTTEFGKVLLAEFGYDGKLMPSFPLNPAVPRQSMWILKKYLLPKMYWHGMMRGRM